MQLWMEIIVVTLHKITETMPWEMHAVIKIKGAPMGSINLLLVHYNIFRFNQIKI